MRTVLQLQKKRCLYAYLNTIDLDRDLHYPVLFSCTKDFLSYVVNKIKYYGRKKKCLLKIEVRDSNSKGYHIRLWCNRKCDLCRFVFDDFERYRRDNNRKSYFRNVLFQKKAIISRKCNKK